MEKRTRKYEIPTRGTHMIDFRVSTQEIKEMYPLSAYQFWYCIACSQCSHQLANIRIGLDPVEGSDLKLNWFTQCPECQTEMSFKYVKDYTTKKYANYNEWNTLWEVECNNCRIDVLGCDKWKVISTSGNEYEWDSSTDFFEFDETLGKPVGITDLDFYVKVLQQS